MAKKCIYFMANKLYFIDCVYFDSIAASMLEINLSISNFRARINKCKN